jgi:hypothetical protein
MQWAAGEALIAKIEATDQNSALEIDEWSYGFY